MTQPSSRIYLWIGLWIGGQLSGRRRWRAGVQVALALLALANCHPAGSHAPQQAAETPQRQFILGNMRIEERRDGQVVWTGHAQRADGDLSSTAVERVVMRHLPQKAGDMAYTIEAPTGQLQLDSDTANFQDVRIVDQTGATLYAGAAAYEKASDTIVAQGPLRFVAAGMIAHAGQGVVYLDRGEVAITGPVQGTYTPAPE